MNRRDFVASAAASAAVVAATPKSCFAAAMSPNFQFHSSFWANLHHKLHYQSQVLQAVYQTGNQLSPMGRIAYSDLKGIPTPLHLDWYAALEIYHRYYQRLDFVFSDTMRVIDDELTKADKQSTVGRLNLPSPLMRAFELAAPVYRRTQWARDDASNRAFIDTLRKPLAQFGPELGRRLPQIYGTDWLHQPYRVDVMPYAQREGSYSNNADRFVHIAMSTADPDEEGLSGVDLLFHEASHSIVDPDRGTIGEPIAGTAKRLAQPAPDNFWHTVIFFTPGRLLERSVHRAGLGTYTMVANRGQEALFKRYWPRYYIALEQHWQPYMNGYGTREAALEACVKEIFLA